MDVSLWGLIGSASGLLVGVLALITIHITRSAMKNRSKHDYLKYSFAQYNEPLHIDVSNPFLGGHRGGTEAHRTGAVGGSGDGAGGGTGARMKIDEFSGIDQMIEPELEEAGFAVGVVRGVRAFDIDPLGRLRGVTYAQVWTPGENHAECRKSNHADLMYMALRTSLLGRSSYEPPEPERREDPHAMRDCNHGFYAYYDGSNDYGKADRVSAVIEGYGETVIGSRGFRSMKARIVALHISESVKPYTARLLERNYPDVPILATFEQMVSEFPPDSAGNEPTPDSDPDFWTRPA